MKEKVKEVHEDQLSVIKMRNDILKEKPFLDVKELGQILGISRATIYRMISNGDIPIVKMGGRTKFRQDDITRIFQSRVQS